MYEKLTECYVRDPEQRKFFAESNPWALHGILRTTAGGRRPRRMAASGSSDLVALRDAYLETEGDLEANS